MPRASTCSKSMGCSGIGGELQEEGGAGFEEVAPGGGEVACVPGVGDVARLACVFHDEVEFGVGVAAEELQHVLHVVGIHADDEVVGVVVVGGEQACLMARASDAVFGEFLACHGVDGVAEFVIVGGCRGDEEVVFGTGLPY